MLSPPAVGLIDPDYYYKSIAIQISDVAGMTLIFPTGDQNQDHCMLASNGLRATIQTKLTHQYLFPLNNVSVLVNVEFSTDISKNINNIPFSLLQWYVLLPRIVFDIISVQEEAQLCNLNSTFLTQAVPGSVTYSAVLYLRGQITQKGILLC